MYIVFVPQSPSHAFFPHFTLSHWYQPTWAGPVSPSCSLIFLNE
jgi:hypothetical protein